MPILCSIEPQVTPLRAPSAPSALTKIFGTTNSDTPLIPAGAPSLRARTKWMVLSARSCSPAEMKIFVPGIFLLPSASFAAFVRNQPRTLPPCGSRRLLGAVPSPAPFFRHEHFLLCGLPCHDNRGGAARGGAAIHQNRHMGRPLNFVARLAQRHRRALPAIFRRRGQAQPAAFGDLLVGLLEAFRRRHAAVVVPGAAFEIAGAIEWLQHFLGEFGGLAQNRLPPVGGGIAIGGKIILASD